MAQGAVATARRFCASRSSTPQLMAGGRMPRPRKLRLVSLRITPGTLTEDSLLEARRHNYLAAFAEVRDDHALAWVDISTGEVWVMACPPARLAPELARLRPREVLLADGAPEGIIGTVEESLRRALAERDTRWQGDVYSWRSQLGMFTLQTAWADLLLTPFAILGAWLGVRAVHCADGESALFITRKGTRISPRSVPLDFSMSRA